MGPPGIYAYMPYMALGSVVKLKMNRQANSRRNEYYTDGTNYQTSPLVVLSFKKGALLSTFNVRNLWSFPEPTGGLSIV